MFTHLKFSWGHIIAFLAIIAISYTTFIGATYMTGGSFMWALGITAIVDVLLLTFFIGAQTMKATGRKFAQRIRLERFLVLGSPIAFIICMIPYYHLGGVYRNNDTISDNFAKAITSAEQLFIEYDEYCEERINGYEKRLKWILKQRRRSPNQFKLAGFDANETGKEATIKINNMVEALRLQLQSQEYYELRNDAHEWINDVRNGVSVWNVFQLSYNKIKVTAQKLTAISKHRNKNEHIPSPETKIKNFSSKKIKAMNNNMNTVRKYFVKKAFPTVGFILVSVVFYIAMLLPYILQERNLKSFYRLLGEIEPDDTPINFKDSDHSKSDTSADDTITSIEKSSYSNSYGKDKNNDYDSFTL